MNDTLIFSESGKLDLSCHIVSETHILTYLTKAIEEKEVMLTEEVFAMMSGKNQKGKRKTVLFFMDGTIKKTPLTPFQIHKPFGIKKGVANQYILRQVLNFHQNKHPKYAALITPSTTFSRFNANVWANLNHAISFHRGVKQTDGLQRSLINFSFGAVLEIQIGIQSVRQTFLVDVLEAWTIQHNHLLGAQLLTQVSGVTNPTNQYMKNKIANMNKKIDRNNKKKSQKKDQQKRIHTVLINPEEFTESLHIFAKLLPMIKDGYLQKADIDSLPRPQRTLFKRILKWKEGDNHHNPS